MSVTFRTINYSATPENRHATAMSQSEALLQLDIMRKDYNEKDISFTIKEDWREGNLYDVLVEIF